MEGRALKKLLREQWMRRVQILVELGPWMCHMVGRGLLRVGVAFAELVKRHFFFPMFVATQGQLLCGAHAHTKPT